MPADPMCASARSAISARRPGDHLAAIAAMAHDGRFLPGAADSCSLIPASVRDRPTAVTSRMNYTVELQYG
jgi:hypothetical protein